MLIDFADNCIDFAEDCIGFVESKVVGKN